MKRFEFLKQKIGAYSQALRRILVKGALFGIYVIGVGTTKLALWIFKPEWRRHKNQNDTSSWIDAEGYEPTMTDCKKQS